MSPRNMIGGLKHSDTSRRNRKVLRAWLCRTGLCRAEFCLTVDRSLAKVRVHTKVHFEPISLNATWLNYLFSDE